MKFASVKPDELAVVKDDAFVLIGDALAREGALPKGASMIDLMTHFNRVEGALAKAMLLIYRKMINHNTFVIQR